MPKLAYRVEVATALLGTSPISGYYSSKAQAYSFWADRQAEGHEGERVGEWEEIGANRYRRTESDSAAVQDFCEKMILQAMHRFVSFEELQSEYKSRLSRLRKIHVCGPQCSDPCKIIQQRNYRKWRREQGKDLPK